MPDLLTAQELIAEEFGSSKKMSPEKLYRLAKQQKVPCVVLDGRVFFSLSAWRDWVRANAKVKSTPEVLNNYGRLRAVSE